MANLNRRRFNKALGGSVSLIPLSALLGSPNAAAAALDPESAAARALKFTLESEKEGHSCSKCLFYSTVDESMGTCIVFGNSQVPSVGWCTSFQMKKTL